MVKPTRQDERSGVQPTYVSDKSGLSGSRVRLEQPPHWPPNEPWGAQFRTEDVRKVMAEVFEDDPDYVVTLMAAQTVWSQRLLDHNAASGDREAFVAAAKQVGSGFGLVTDATGLAGIAKGEELDEAQERKVKAVMAVVNTGLSIPQTAGWPVTVVVVGAWTGLVEDSAKIPGGIGFHTQGGTVEEDRTMAGAVLVRGKAQLFVGMSRGVEGRDNAADVIALMKLIAPELITDATAPGRKQG